MTFGGLVSWRFMAGHIGLLALALLPAACGTGDDGGKARAVRTPQVAVQTVARSDVDVVRGYLVTLLPGEQTDIISRASGYVLALNVDRGDPILKGSKLAVVEREELTSQQMQAAAQLEAARATLSNARDHAARMATLVERSFVAASEVDAADTAVRVAEAQVRAAQAALEASRTRRGYADISAPFDGYVIRRNVDVGGLVGPQGPALFSVGTLEPIKAVAAIPQADVLRLVVGMPVRLSLDGEPTDQAIEGTVTRMSPALDTATRTLEVEMVFPNPDRRLRPGMFGRVTLVLDRLEQVLVVLPRAVSRQGRSGFAYVVQDGLAMQKRLEFGRTLPDGRVEVINGLDEGDSLIVLGRDLVRDGMQVRTVPLDSTGSAVSPPASE